MRKEYKLGEDLFLAIAVLLIAGAIITKLFDASFGLGLTVITAAGLFKLGVVSLLFNIALNIQELTRK